MQDEETGRVRVPFVMTRSHVLPTTDLGAAVPYRRWSAALLVALAIGAFVIDAVTPTGIVDWLVYLVLCLGFQWLCGTRWSLAFAAACSLLLVLGLWLSPANLSPWVAFLNRCLGLICIWVAVLASRAYARRSESLSLLAREQADSIRASEAVAGDLQRNELHLIEGLIGLRSVLTSSMDPVVLIDDRGTIQLASDSVERVFGHRAEDLVGRKVEVLMPEPFASSHAGYLERYHRTGQSSVMDQPRLITGRRKDGSEFPLELSISRVDLPDRRPWFTGTLRDVTTRLAGERERAFLLESERSARLEAERATRAKDEFLAMLSHELRTPLNAALGWVQILRRGKRDEETLAEGLAAIERSTRAQAQLISDMLDMSRILSGKLQAESKRVVLTEVARAAFDTLRQEAGAKGVELGFEAPTTPLHVNGDATRLQQVIWNLLTNAVKFTPAGGSVRLQLHGREGSALVEVVDTGAGISAEFLPFVFDQFRQADSSITRKHGGLGLGLALVRHLVGLHGGTVEAASAGPGKGATFSVRLPIAEAEDDSSAGPDHESGWSDPDLSGLRVLVVDDDPEACRLVRRMLAECCAEVETAASAAHGLERLVPFRPDVLVSDLSMPEMDGFQLLAEVRRRDHDRHTPALALSALARPEDRRRALEAGFDRYLSKPIERSALLAVVAELALLESIAPQGRKD